LTNSFAQLKQAQGRFKDCFESVESVKKANEGKTLLVPLTSSLYVPGEFADSDKVIVDVGTGYFVEKSTADALKFYQGKIDFVSVNLTKLQETITGKQNNLRVLVNVMQSRITEGAPRAIKA